MNFPKQIGEISATLLNNKYNVYVVGGAVRDHFLELEASDFDLATNAIPSAIKSIFPKTLNIGLEFGTVIVIHDNYQVEITTLRKDGAYRDSRRPDSVSYTDDINEDLARRDFTINAIAYNILSQTYIDPFKGKEDIKKRTIKAVGNPLERFQEDTLRIFRAARFAAQLNFEIENKTYLAAKKASQSIELPSFERINVELVKLIKSNHFKKGLKALKDWSLLKLLNIDCNNIDAIPQIYDTEQRIAYMLKNKKNIKEILQQLRFKKSAIKTISGLIENNFSYEMLNLRTKDLKILSKDIIDIGASGKEIGLIQNRLLNLVKNKRIKNKKKLLLNKAQEIFNELN